MSGDFDIFIISINHFVYLFIGLFENEIMDFGSVLEINAEMRNMRNKI